MINGVIVKELKKYEDDRGYLIEIYRRDEVDSGVAMSYLSMTLPGVARGPHEHVYQTDYFIFPGAGDFTLYLWDKRANSITFGEKIEMTVGAIFPCTVIVPPGVVHGYKCISSVPAMSINFPDKLYKGVNKQDEIDEVRWEQDENSPYKIN
jgi:dTDP-4-dehydrorhamnose 3,5-epimerase